MPLLDEAAGGWSVTPVCAGGCGVGSVSKVVRTGFSTGGGAISTSTFGTTMSGGARRCTGVGGSGGTGGGSIGFGVKTVTASGSLGSGSTFPFIMLTTPIAIRACSPATRANLPALLPLSWYAGEKCMMFSSRKEYRTAICWK